MSTAVRDLEQLVAQYRKAKEEAEHTIRRLGLHEKLMALIRRGEFPFATETPAGEYIEARGAVIEPDVWAVSVSVEGHTVYEATGFFDGQRLVVAEFHDGPWSAAVLERYRDLRQHAGREDEDRRMERELHGKLERYLPLAEM